MRVFLFLLLASCAKPGAPVDLHAARCLGPKDARSFAVYLHGMDVPSLSDQEVHNREVLARVAHALSIRIALPRTMTACRNDPQQLCWGWTFDDQELAIATPAITRAAHECFGDRDFDVIGFSNGGYLVDKLFRSCSLATWLPGARRLVTVGASMMKGPLEPQPGSLAGCGSLTMLSGSDDEHNADPEENLLHRLEAKHAAVRAIHYAGGHVLVEQPLRDALRGQ